MQELFTWLWIGWIIAFVVIEGLALLWAKRMDDKNPDTKYDGGTLSELVWRFIKRYSLVTFLFAGFWLWLTLHFFTERV